MDIAKAQDILDRGFTLHQMIIDAAKCMRSHAEKGHLRRAQEYADEIHALQRMQHAHRMDPTWVAKNPLEDCTKPRIRTFEAWANALMQSPLARRDPNSWTAYSPEELTDNPAFNQAAA